MEGLSTLKPDTYWCVGDKSKCSFWTDKWLEGGSIIERLDIPGELEYTRAFTVSEFMVDNKWEVP